ncbi:MAG: hypothetical protein GDA65_19335 [Nitrospira sp. CR1.1]|jgi:hypothetical protein|nr:hypothetical protein [Nitrospira sp. CR1.1]
MDSIIIHIPGKPRVSPELDDQDVLWRYLDAAKFLDFLHHQTLFFTRGDRFEDKFEGAFTKSLKHSIERSYRDNNIDYTFDQFRRRLRECVFVNCWHRGQDDSMAMWQIYGRSSCSLALTTTIGQLRQSLQEQDLPYDLAIEKVQYVKHWDDPALDIAPYSRVFAYKTNAYEYENEVRVLIDRFAGEFDNEILEVGMPIKVAHKTLLRSIVVAPEAPVWFELLVREVVRRYGITVSVSRSMLASQPL